MAEAPPPTPDGPLPIHRGPMLFPNIYAWYVLVSALDVMVTVKLLVHLGEREDGSVAIVAGEKVVAEEANTFAQWSIEQFGTWGLIGLKFLSVIVVVAICEHIGRRRPRLGHGLALLAIFLSLLPIAAALVQTGYLTATGRLIIEDWPRH